MTAQLDLPDASTFRYLALADRLAASIRDGRFPPGTRLPSVRDLCEMHGASLATVTHALHRLEDAGLIEARPRLGFFACGLTRQDARGVPSGVTPEALDARRERLMALAASQDGYLSLGHLSLPHDLLPLTALRKLCQQQLRGDPSPLVGGSVAGSEALRQQLALRLNRRGCRVSADDIVATQGEGEALQLCLRQLTQPGDRVAVTRPVPLRVLELLQAGGIAVVELPAHEDPREVLAALEASIHTGAITACIADIATAAAAGTDWNDDSCRALVTLCTRHELPLIECNLFGDLPIGPVSPLALKAFDEDDRVLHCGSLACVTGPGFSIGWVASGRHRVQLRAGRAVHGELLPSLNVRILEAFLSGDDMDRHLRRLRRHLARRVAAWVAAVKETFPQGTTVGHGPVGYQLWVTLPEGISALDLLAKTRDQGVAFVPGAVFTSSQDFDRCLRLTCAHALDDERQAALQLVGRLAKALAQTP